MGFGVSLSSNRDLTDIGVGAGYAADFGGGSWSVGAGYYKLRLVHPVRRPRRCGSSLRRRRPRHRRVHRSSRRADRPPRFPDGEQWSVGLKADYEAFGFGVTYVKIDLDTADDGERRGRQPAGRRLVRLGRLLGRRLLRQHPERRRPTRRGRFDGDDDAYGVRRSTTSAAAPRSTAASARPTACSGHDDGDTGDRSPTSVSRWRSDPEQRDGERGKAGFGPPFSFRDRGPDARASCPRARAPVLVPASRRRTTARDRCEPHRFRDGHRRRCCSPGSASAQGIALFGDARLGLGYNIDNDGGVLVDDDGNAPDDLRAISRVRFGVNMTGETDSGITFGATIRADNAQGGEGGDGRPDRGRGLRLGRLGHADLRRHQRRRRAVGRRRPGQLLADRPRATSTRRGSSRTAAASASDDGAHFAENPFARPTIRYDFDIDGFGVSLSSNRDLTDIGVGAGYAADFAGGSWSVGAGYYKFDSFVDDRRGRGCRLDRRHADHRRPGCRRGRVDRDRCPRRRAMVGRPARRYETFAFGVTYIQLSSDTETDGKVEADNLLVGGSYSFDAFSVGAFYGKVLSAEGTDDFGVLDGDDAYGLTAQYDLGGGATVNGGIANYYSDLADGRGRQRDDRRLRHRHGVLTPPERRSPPPLPAPGGRRYGRRPCRSRTSRPASPPPSPAPAGRPASVTLVAVSKVQPPERVRAVLGGRPARLRREPGAGGRGALAGAPRRVPRRRAAPRRPAADQQARPRARALRRDPQPRPRQPRAQARDGGAGPRRLPDALRPGQHRPRAAEGRRRPRRPRRLPRRLPRPTTCRSSA